MKFNDLELIQSYVLTTAKYDFSIDEKRIMYFLVMIAQADLQGKTLNKDYVIGENLFKEKIIKFNTKNLLLNDKSKNHSRIKKALISLLTKVIEYENSDVWTAFSIIQSPIINKGSEIIEFTVNPIMWDAILKISAKGYSKYELKTAMSFESVYAMRFYELFSNNKNPLTFTIEQLKERFKIQDKYKNRPSDFIKYVIKKAQTELDKKAPFSFTFTPLKTNRKITVIKFFPYEIVENKNDVLEKKKALLKMSSSWSLPIEVTRYLKQKYGFDEKGIRANIELFKKAYLEFDLMKFLADIYRTSNHKRNPQGYMIGALKKYIKNKNNAKPVSNKATKEIENLAKKLTDIERQSKK